MKRRPELLSPAGDFERFEAALRFGADAVYLAGSSFGMRAGPQNFPEEDLIKAVKEAHEKGVKVYLTLNTLPRNSEIPLLPDFIEMTASAGVMRILQPISVLWHTAKSMRRRCRCTSPHRRAS